MRKKYFEIRKFFKNLLYYTKRRCSQIKPQLKVEIEDGPSQIGCQPIWAQPSLINLPFSYTTRGATRSQNCTRISIRL